MFKIHFHFFHRISIQLQLTLSLFLSLLMCEGSQQGYLEKVEVMTIRDFSQLTWEIQVCQLIKESESYSKCLKDNGNHSKLLNK